MPSHKISADLIRQSREHALQGKQVTFIDGLDDDGVAILLILAVGPNVAKLKRALRDALPCVAQSITDRELPQ